MSKRPSRRDFLRGVAAAATAASLPGSTARASIDKKTYASLIDLTLCDGCPDRQIPACVESCRVANEDRFPKPDASKIHDYWPQKFHEDWSEKRDVTDRLTPYNWLFVQEVQVDWKDKSRTVHVPRRCMHCDNPPCAKLCPFGVNKKTPEGPVVIDENLCMGGAKCRQVCPWHVPQRQAGVGIYTHLEPLPVGGGVMYKCDLCRDRLLRGERPACVEACPRGAMKIGRRSEIEAEAKRRAKEIGGYLYGDEENGGTSTFYISAVPFEEIDRALVAKANNPKKVMRMHKVSNMLEKHNPLAAAVLASPLVGLAGALAATSLLRRGKEPAPEPEKKREEKKEEKKDENR